MTQSVDFIFDESLPPRVLAQIRYLWLTPYDIAELFQSTIEFV